ncbi:tetratricopeptide repeat protein [Lentzea chajnantorensis]
MADFTEEDAENAFLEAYNMPTGMPKHEALERVARMSDALGHLPLGVSCRIAMIDSAYYLSRYDLMLAPFAWCLGAEEKDPEAFNDYERHSLDWSHKWISTGLRRDPRFSLEQLQAVIGQLADRYGRLGYSVQPVHGARAEYAYHVGDLDGVREHLGRYLATESGPMADCDACVVEEQVWMLARLGRHSEAAGHGWEGLSGNTGCATQPQGILSALLWPLLEIGDLEKAAHAHTTAYRLIKDDEITSYVHEHIRFCALTGNLDRGEEILRRSLHKVTATQLPADEMSFAECASVLLKRLPADVGFDVPSVGTLTAAQLLDRLSARAVELAKAFDERNGTPAWTERVTKALEQADYPHVPLAVPVAAAPAPAEEPVVFGDPVDIATRMVELYESGDFVQARRMLDSLPADMDALLPPDLAAHAGIRRITSGLAPFEQEHFEALLAALPADMALRYRARMAVKLENGRELAQRCLAEATTDYTRTIAALSLAELLDEEHQHDQAGEMMALASSLDVPELRGRVLVQAAEHKARQQDLDGAYADVVAALAGDLPPNARFEGLRMRLRLETLQQRVPEALATAAAFVSSFPLPESAEARWYQVAAIQELDQEGACLAELREAVAVSRVHLSPGHTAHFCFALSGGYVQTNRFVEAAEVLEEALRLVQEGQEDLRLQIVFRLGQVCRTLDELPDAVKHLREAAALLPAEEVGRRAFLLDALASVLHRTDEHEEATATYRAAAELWQSEGNVSEAVGSLIELASALPGEAVRETRSALDDAEALLPSLDDLTEVTRRQAEIAAIRAFLHSQAGEYALAIKYNREAEALATSLSEDGWRTFLVVRSARVLLEAGDPEGSESEARRAATLLPDDSLVGEVLSALSDALSAQQKTPGTDPLVRALTARLS